MSVISALFKSAPSTAAERLAAQQQIVKDCAAEDAALAPKASAYQAEVEAARAAADVVATHRARWIEVLAAAELGDPLPESRDVLEKELAAAIASATALQDRAAIASAGLARLDAKRKVIWLRRNEAEEKLPQLLAEVLHARLGDLAPATYAASEAATDALVEAFATALAHESIAPPGNPRLLEGRSILDLQLPIPKHEAFTSRNVRRNITKEVAARSEAILAEVQRG